MCVCVSLCTTVVHNTAQNSSDNLLYSTGSHHSSDDVYWRGGEKLIGAYDEMIRYLDTVHNSVKWTAINTALSRSFPLTASMLQRPYVAMATNDAA